MRELIKRECYWCPLREIPMREISDCQHAQYGSKYGLGWYCGKTVKEQFGGYNNCVARCGTFNESE